MAWPGGRMQGAVKDILAAYGSFARIIAIGGAIVVVLSFLMNVLSLPFGELVTRIVEAYRGIVHPLMQALFGWWPWPLPDWWHDAAALYFVIGGAVARTLWVFYQRHDASEVGEHYGPPVIGRFKSRAMQTVAVILSAPFWPLSLLAMLTTPYVMRNPNNRNVFAGSHNRYAMWRAERKHYEYVCNLRTVFLLQLIAVFAVAGAAVLVRI